MRRVRRVRRLRKGEGRYEDRKAMTAVRLAIASYRRIELSMEARSGCDGVQIHPDVHSRINPGAQQINRS